MGDMHQTNLRRRNLLIIAMTKYNLKSIYAWNMFLYNGVFLVVSVYLWIFHFLPESLADSVVANQSFKLALVVS